ncbi:MAG: transporter [Mycobacterium sp.]
MNTGTLVASLIMAALLLVLIILMFRAMMRGWKRRALEQGPVIGALPPLPDDVGPAVIPEMTGLYVGSAFAPDRLERIAGSDLGDGAKAVLTRHSQGIMLTRRGVRSLWIPDESITSIRTERFVAGRVAARDGILAIRWRLPSGMEIDTGFRGDDRGEYPDWLEADSE